MNQIKEVVDEYVVAMELLCKQRMEELDGRVVLVEQRVNKIGVTVGQLRPAEVRTILYTPLWMQGRIVYLIKFMKEQRLLTTMSFTFFSRVLILARQAVQDPLLPAHIGCPTGSTVSDFVKSTFGPELEERLVKFVYDTLLAANQDMRDDAINASFGNLRPVLHYYKTHNLMEELIGLAAYLAIMNYKIAAEQDVGAGKMLVWPRLHSDDYDMQIPLIQTWL